MLNIYFGDMPEAIYNTAVYFENTYQDRWITTSLSKEMIKDVDKSDVISLLTTMFFFGTFFFFHRKGPVK